MKWIDAVMPPSESRYSFDDWALDAMTFGGHRYPLDGLTTTYGKSPAEPIDHHVGDYVANGLQASGVVWTVERLRVSVFSEARFLFQGLRQGRPGDLFSTQALQILETPWPGGTTGDLLAKALLHADLAGNSYIVRDGDEAVPLRPDYCELILQPRMLQRGPKGEAVSVGFRKAGLFYWEGGKQTATPAVYLPGEFSHFAPMPDPLAPFRGMSWLTPVIREIQADKQATLHKLKFFENAATPNLAVSLPKEITPEKFEQFVDRMDAKHKGVENAYRTLYTGGGADVTVIGNDFKQLDFKATQGASETRIANAGGVHPAVLGLSEGMAGSSLNAGNYGAAKRATVDGTLRPLWRNFAGSMQVLVPPPSGSRLWYDSRDVAFLRDDEKDRAEIQAREAGTIRQLIDAGYDPASVVVAVQTGDWSRLQHSGLVSVQLLPPGTTATPTPAA